MTKNRNWKLIGMTSSNMMAQLLVFDFDVLNKLQNVGCGPQAADIPGEDNPVEHICNSIYLTSSHSSAGRFQLAKATHC